MTKRTYNRFVLMPRPLWDRVIAMFLGLRLRSFLFAAVATHDVFDTRALSEDIPAQWSVARVSSIVCTWTMGAPSHVTIEPRSLRDGDRVASSLVVTPTTMTSSGVAGEIIPATGGRPWGMGGPITVRA